MDAPRHTLLRGALCAVLLAACTSERLTLVPAPDQARTPPTVRSACALTEQKCSRCHDLERIRLAHHELVDWPVYVDRMRRMPGSGITPDDAAIILRCLRWVESLQRERDLYSLEH